MTNYTFKEIDMKLLFKFDGTYYFIKEGYLFELYNVILCWIVGKIPSFNADGKLVKNKIDMQTIMAYIKSELGNINKFKPELEKLINKL